MKKVILFVMTMSMLNASFCSICERDRERLRHRVYDQEQEVKKLKKKLYNLTVQLQYVTKQKIKFRNELENARNSLNNKDQRYLQQIKNRQREDRTFKREKMIENQKLTKEQLESKSYQKNLIWYKRRFEECKASLEVL